MLFSDVKPIVLNGNEFGQFTLADIFVDYLTFYPKFQPSYESASPSMYRLLPEGCDGPCLDPWSMLRPLVEVAKVDRCGAQGGGGCQWGGGEVLLPN